MNTKDLEKAIEMLADFKLLEGKYQQLKEENKRLIAQNESLIAVLAPTNSEQVDG